MDIKFARRSMARKALRDCASSVVAAAVLLALPADVVAQTATFVGEDYGAAASARAIVAADFNRDGWLDAATAGARGGVRVLLNNGRGGGFRALPEFALGGGPFGLAAGDLNRDGIPDLVVANADANAVDVLIGAGDGAFTNGPTRFVLGGAVGANPRGVALADFDGDGKLDIVVTEYATNAWRVIYGDGNGSYTRLLSFSGVLGVTRPQGVVTGDFNHDGRVDVAIASTGASLVTEFAQLPSGSFSPTNVTVGGPVNVLAAGDFDSDGWLDLAAASSSNSRIYTLRGGSSGLAWTGTLTTGASPRGIAAIDVNQDGRIDLATGNGAANSVTIHLGRASQPGTFGDPLTIAVGGGGRAVAAGDFDHDGAIDLATANEFGNSATMLTNMTAFAAPAFRFTVQQLGAVQSGGGVSAVADFDRDGRPDIAASLNGLAVWLTSRGRIQVDSAARSPRHIAIADVSGEGAPDLVTTDYFTGGTNVRVYINRGDGTFTAAAAVTLNVEPRDIAAADLNRDGRIDLAILALDRSSQQGVLRVALGQGDGTFTIANVDTVVPFAQRIVVADVNRDGSLDLAVGATGGDIRGVSIWFGKGDGTPARVEFVDLPRYSTDFALADFDEDGRLDLVATDSDRGLQIRVALPGGGFGPVAFQTAAATGSAIFIECFRVADVDVDGHLDVITGNLDILYGHGDGTFTIDRTSTFDAPGFEQVSVADFNLDSLPDLIFADEVFNVALNDRSHVNHPPTVDAGGDHTINYIAALDSDTSFESIGTDPDMHELDYVWRDAAGAVVTHGPFFRPSDLPPAQLASGSHTFTVTASDGRGGEASDSMVVTITPYEEIYILSSVEPNGAWRLDEDPLSPDGRRWHHPDAGAPKLAAALANPVNYFDIFFPADPTQSYKLWLRLKADNNFWGNDSVLVQFEDAVDANGRPIAPIGTTSALAINLEECSGCGISGWGWEDDGWGAKDRTTATVVRFPSGRGRIRVQTREDGVSVDQIVLSARRFLTTRPGTAKNDTLILPPTVPE